MEDNLVAALENLLRNVDEDCPQEYRTEHLREAMREAQELIEQAQRVGE